MKILFATMQFGRGYRQGTERYLSLLIAGLREAGHEAVVIAGDPEQRGDALPLGAPVDGERNTLAYPTGGWMAVRGVSPHALEGVIRDVQPDIVHLVNPAHIGVGIGEAARNCGMPLVTSVLDFWWLCPKQTLYHWSGGMCDAAVRWTECVQCIARTHESRGLRVAASLPFSPLILPGLLAVRGILRGLPPAEWSRWRQRQSIVLEALDASDAVIFISRTGQRLIGSRLSRAVSAFVQSGLEPHWFENIHVRSNPSVSSKLILGYAGAMVRHKGVHTLIEAARLLGERGVLCEVRIASAGGDATYEALIKARCAGVNAQWLGRIEPAAMPAFYDALDFAVIPSLWPENLPFVASEAYARGVPVLCSDVPGIAELVIDESCRFPAGDAPALADRIAEQAQLEEPPLLPAIPSCQEMTERTLAIYERLATRPRGRGRGAAPAAAPG